MLLTLLSMCDTNNQYIIDDPEHSNNVHVRVIESSGHTYNLYVNKEILTRDSPVFKRMFSFSGSDHFSEANKTKNGIYVISLHTSLYPLIFYCEYFNVYMPPPQIIREIQAFGGLLGFVEDVIRETVLYIERKHGLTFDPNELLEMFTFADMYNCAVMMACIASVLCDLNMNISHIALYGHTLSYFGTVPPKKYYYAGIHLYKWAKEYKNILIREPHIFAYDIDFTKYYEHVLEHRSAMQKRTIYDVESVRLKIVRSRVKMIMVIVLLMMLLTILVYLFVTICNDVL